MKSTVVMSAVVMSAVGCGNSQTTVVRGVVTYDGNKVPTGWVTFVEKGNGTPINGEIAQDGTYRLRAEPGTYLVGISALRPFPPGTKPKDTFKMKLPPPYVPPAYNLAERSGLTATVESKKENVIDFPLEPVGRRMTRKRR